MYFRTMNNDGSQRVEEVGPWVWLWRTVVAYIGEYNRSYVSRKL